MTNFIDVEAEQTALYNEVMGINPDLKVVTNEFDNSLEANPNNQKVRHSTEKTKPHLSALQRLKSLSVTDRVETMRANLGNETYVFDGVAISGQITLFYAKPSTGKTLLFIHLLIQSIEHGVIKPSDIFYINADDDFRGLVTKAEIAKEHGFEMISPSEAGISSNEIIEILVEIARTPEGRGKIVILDTVKKFVNLMSKHEQSAFYSALRTLSANEITVILAGHANKYPDAEGELVYEGTSDTTNDIDCAYSINRMVEQDADEMIIELRNCKPRGDVLKKVSYKYDNRADTPWPDRLKSVSLLDDKTAGIARHEKLKQDKIDKYESAKIFVSELLKDGSLNLSDITQKHAQYKGDESHDLHPLASEVSVRSLKAALDNLAGLVWKVSRGGKHNEKRYRLIDGDGGQYRRCKNGE